MECYKLISFCTDESEIYKKFLKMIERRVEMGNTVLGAPEVVGENKDDSNNDNAPFPFNYLDANNQKTTELLFEHYSTQLNSLSRWMEFDEKNKLPLALGESDKDFSKVICVQQYDDKRSEEDGKEWCKADYEPGVFSNYIRIHNGLKKLLESSIFTTLYGLHRASEYWKSKRDLVTHDFVLKNSLLLYIGSGGIKDRPHHFSYLLQAFPDLHIAAYDVRNTTATPADDMEKSERDHVAAEALKRLHIFHKIFENSDLESWINFCNKNKWVNVMVISDIRSDWKFSLDCLKGSRIACLHFFQHLASMGGDLKNFRTLIDPMLTGNIEINNFVEDKVTVDTKLQYLWASKLMWEAKNVSIFSVKERDPYDYPGHGENQQYVSMNGMSMIQTFTDASSELRKQLTTSKDHFHLELPPTENGAGSVFIQWFKKKMGDPLAFASESLDYSQYLQKGNKVMKGGEHQFTRNFETHNVHRHDRTIAFINDPTKRERKRGSHEIIHSWYNKWSSEYLEQKSGETVVLLNKRVWKLKFEKQILKRNKRMKQKNFKPQRFLNVAKLELLNMKNPDLVLGELETMKAEHLKYYEKYSEGQLLRKMKQKVDVMPMLSYLEKHIKEQENVWVVDEFVKSSLCKLCMTLNMHKMQDSPNISFEIYSSGIADILYQRYFGAFQQMRLNLIEPHGTRMSQEHPAVFEKLFGPVTKNVISPCTSKCVSVLNMKPGSELSENKEVPQRLRENNKRKVLKMISDDPLNFAFQFYHNWLMPLLMNKEEIDMTAKLTRNDLSSAMGLFVTQLKSEAVLGLKGYKDGQTLCGLNFFRWPRGSPIAYAASKYNNVQMLTYVLEEAITQKDREFRLTGNQRIVDFEFERRKAGGKVNETLLSCAVYNGSLEVVEFLRSKNANPSFVNSYDEDLMATAQKAVADNQNTEKLMKCQKVLYYLSENLQKLPTGYRWKIQS